MREHNAALSPPASDLSDCEFRLGIGDDIIPLFAFLVQRIVVSRKRGGDIDLFSEAAIRQVVFERPVIGDKGHHRLPVVFLQSLALSSQSDGACFLVVAEIANSLPPAATGLPFRIGVALDETKDFRRAIGHHVHVGDAGHRNSDHRTVPSFALEYPAEPAKAPAAYIDDGNTVLRQVAAGQLRKHGQNDSLGVALDDQHPVREEQVRLGDIKKALKKSIVPRIKLGMAVR